MRPLRQIVILTKSTRLERACGEQCQQSVWRAHGAHVRAAERLGRALGALPRTRVRVCKAHACSGARADVIVGAGGDGTFLEAAALARRTDQLCVGFNTDPLRSRGALCLRVGEGSEEERTATAWRRLLQALHRHEEMQQGGEIAGGLFFRSRLAWRIGDGGTSSPSTDLAEAAPKIPTHGLALNELALGHRHWWKTCKVCVESAPGAPPDDWQGSGLLAATGSGSGAWLRAACAEAPALAPDARTLALWMREPLCGPPAPLLAPTAVVRSPHDTVLAVDGDTHRDLPAETPLYLELKDDDRLLTYQ